RGPYSWCSAEAKKFLKASQARRNIDRTWDLSDQAPRGPVPCRRARSSRAEHNAPWTRQMVSRVHEGRALKGTRIALEGGLQDDDSSSEYRRLVSSARRRL